MSKRTGGRQPHLTPQHRLTAHPNEILTRAPLLQAVEQMDSGEPLSCEPRLRAILTWDGPPRMKPVPRDMPDLTGERRGSLVVRGLLDKGGFGSGNGKASWVVRCDCGGWETRSTKAIRSGKEPDDCCVRCRTVVQRQREQKRQAYFARNGRWPDAALFSPRSARG